MQTSYFRRVCRERREAGNAAAGFRDGKTVTQTILAWQTFSCWFHNCDSCLSQGIAKINKVGTFDKEKIHDTTYLCMIMDDSVETKNFWKMEHQKGDFFKKDLEILDIRWFSNIILTDDDSSIFYTESSLTYKKW